MTYQLPRTISNLEECLLSQKIDWLISLSQPDRQIFNKLTDVLISHGVNWLVNLASPQRNEGRDPLFTEFMASAGLDWVVALDHVSRVENLSYDERVRAAGATWCLPMDAAPRYTMDYSTMVQQTGATWMLTMNECVQETRKTYSETVVDAGAIWHLPMSMSNVV